MVRAIHHFIAGAAHPGTSGRVADVMNPSAGAVQTHVDPATAALLTGHRDSGSVDLTVPEELLMRLGHLKDEPVSVVEAEPRSRPRRPGRDRVTGARACVLPTRGRNMTPSMSLCLR